MVQLTDADGNVSKTYEYDSFGNEVNSDKKDDNPFRYCGEYYDKETDTIYLRARYYQPYLGRFLTRDTDTVAVAVSGVPGTGILKVGKYADKIAGLVNKGRKVAAKFKVAASTVKTVGKKIGRIEMFFVYY